jgi:hypothetical protein
MKNDFDCEAAMAEAQRLRDLKLNRLFNVGDVVADIHGEVFTITKVRFDVDGTPIYTGTYNNGENYMLLRNQEISLTNPPIVVK